MATVSVSDQLRRAIRDSGMSLNALAKLSGVGVSNLSRFMAGAFLRLDKADRLCRVLSLRLVTSKRKAR